MRIVVFQHLAGLHAGDGIEVATVELDVGDPILSLDDSDALLVFGGPMNAEEEKYAWLRRETEVIRAVAAFVMVPSIAKEGV